MKGQVSIDLRPAVVEARSRIGDWEMDTITGKNSTGYLLTVVERRSKLTLMKRVADRQADQMAKAMVQLLRPYKKTSLPLPLTTAKSLPCIRKYQRV